MSVEIGPALTSTRRATLDALAARILPGTDGPGAAATDVGTAIDHAIRHRALRGMRRAIEQLLDRLDSQAHDRCAAPFSACAPGDQDALLCVLERDPSPWTTLLFNTLIGLSLEGLLGDPVHGGNRDGRGWESIGLRVCDVRSGLCREVRED